MEGSASNLAGGREICIVTGIRMLVDPAVNEDPSQNQDVNQRRAQC